MKGTVELPGDKSISHRVAMLAALADAECTIDNFNNGADCQSTLGCLSELGIGIEQGLVIHPAAMQSPDKPLDCGNSGSSMRMLTGLLCGQNIAATLTGDDSLLQRPMGRVAEPLRKMGAIIELDQDEFAPIRIQKGVDHPIEYKMTVVSAQVKSAVLLAGLSYTGTKVLESIPTRDHTERLLDFLNVTPGPAALPLKSFRYRIPGDISAAAFFVVGALLHPGSEINLERVLLNPLRIGYLTKLREAGADIEVLNEIVLQNEPVGDLRVRYTAQLRPIIIEPVEVPSLIDEIPVLSMLGPLAGFQVSGARELRFKECDRIRAVVDNFRNAGLAVHEEADGYKIERGKFTTGTVRTFGDHRIAMAFAIAGFKVDDTSCVSISFPDFYSLLSRLSG